jgi:DNA polymerase-3 subunit delta'
MADAPPASPGPGLVGVLGHAQAQAAVVRALGRGQLHHALVFVGPRGVGKATFARGLGCALLCPERPGLGCGACPTCQRVLAGNHPDVDWLLPDSKAGLISVEAARACHVRQTHAPYEGRAYLVVVDPADALGEAAGNALLKTIEEPRPGVHFALLTTNLQGVLPTILSRSLPIRLGRLDDDVVRSIVDARAADAPAERRDMAVLLAEGSAGMAVELASDPSLARSLELVKQAIAAVRAGPPAIFGGDNHPLWLAWAAATAPVEAASSDSSGEPEPEPEPAAGGKKKKATKKASKAAGGDGEPKAASKKDAPALQRAAVRRLVELWVLHVREHLRGRPGLPGLPPPPGASAAAQVAAITALQRLGARVERMGNVRLMLEQGLLEQNALLAGT